MLFYLFLSVITCIPAGAMIPHVDVISPVVSMIQDQETISDLKWVLLIYNHLHLSRIPHRWP